MQHASILKVRVLRNNCEAVVFGVLPNSGIIRTPQSAWMNVSGTRIKIGEDFR